ncbi:MAG TPA: hypothetical protein VK206_11650 [Anaerolineales bacterium]|nr:hypothetical protein [Anaerolineales bacterium]
MIKIQLVRHWIPAVFCAFVVYGYVGMPTNSDRVDTLKYMFIWLPMCFFYAGMASYSMQTQIRELQAEVKELRRVATEVRHDT